MTEVINFRPRSSYDANTNLKNFISYAKKLKPLGIDQPFEANSWSARGVLLISNVHSDRRIHFGATVEDVVSNKRVRQPRSNKEGLQEPFLSFAKALISYNYAISPSTSVGDHLMILKFLQQALKKLTGTVCPTEITPAVLNYTCQQLVENYSSAYCRSIHLQKIYSTMTELGLVSAPTVWRSFVKCPRNDVRRSGVEFDHLRISKLPSPVALDALAHIFNNPKDKLDIAITSVCAILLCAPDRISEALASPVNCIAKAELSRGSNNQGLSLRWFPAKGGLPMLKQVVASMADVAIRAVDKLNKLGEQARAVARWYEMNPTKIYLPFHLEHLRFKEFISKNEIGLILGDGKFHPKTIEKWIARNIPEHKSTKTHRARLNDPYFPFKAVEKAVLALLPFGFPVLNMRTGLRFSEALCICLHGELSNDAPYICLIQQITESMVTLRFGGRSYGDSIFEKHGLTEENGDPLYIKSHMFRHYLNTLAKSGGMSDIEGDKWAGRKTASHSRTYDHHSDRDVLADIKLAIAKNKPMVGPLLNMDKRMLFNRNEFAKIRVISAHTTELGYCLHDFASLPCQIHGDHINCNEHVYIKGDAEKEKELRRLQFETHALLDKAKKALSEKEYGADAWVKHQRLVIEKTAQVLKIMDDPNIAMGSILQPSGIKPASRIMQAMEKRFSSTGKTQFGDDIKSIEDVHRILATQIIEIQDANDGKR